MHKELADEFSTMASELNIISCAGIMKERLRPTIAPEPLGLTSICSANKQLEHAIKGIHDQELTDLTLTLWPKIRLPEAPKLPTQL